MGPKITGGRQGPDRHGLGVNPEKSPGRHCAVRKITQPDQALPGEAASEDYRVRGFPGLL